MAAQAIQDVFLWCSIINMGILLFWFLIIAFANEWVYKVHSRFFKLPKEKFDAIHYAGIAFFKIGVFFFNIVPYIAMRIVY